MSDNIFYKSGYKAQLAVRASIQTDIYPEKDIVTRFYTIRTDGMMIANVGYAWDFASGAFDTRTIIRPSLWHDIGCQAIVDRLLDDKWKPEVDLLFRRLCVEDGMCNIRIAYTYKAVKYGSCAGTPKLILSAPDKKAAKIYNVPLA